jgi:hypothetical protein
MQNITYTTREGAYVAISVQLKANLELELVLASSGNVALVTTLVMHSIITCSGSDPFLFYWWH